MKTIITALLIAPLLVFSQIEEQSIVSLKSYTYEWNSTDSSMMKIDSHQLITMLNLTKSYYTYFNNETSMLKISWSYHSNNENGDPVYYDHFGSKIIFNKQMNEIFLYQDYDKELYTYKYVVVFSELNKLKQ